MTPTIYLCFGIFIHLLCALVTETSGSGLLKGNQERMITNNDVSYELVRKIGTGAFGEVFLVKEVVKDVEYAMKIMKKEHIRKMGAEELVGMEMVLHKTLSHSHIVTVIDAFESFSEIYIITEYCSDGDLHAKFESVGGLPESTAKMIIHQVSLGLQFLHDQNIIHRDIKPNNIFLTDSGEAKIGDFGLAIQLSQGERESRACGSNGYKAPEILEKKPYSKGVDIWALGVTLFTIIYDTNPVTHTWPSEYTRFINACDNVRFPSTPSVSSELRHLLNRMLEPEEDQRITIDEVLAHPWFASVVETVEDVSTSNGVVE